MSRITFVEMSEIWEACFVFNFEISITISLLVTSEKEKEKRVYSLLVAILLEWYLYFKTAFRAGSLTLSTTRSWFFIRWSLDILYNIKKNAFKISTALRSVLTISFSVKYILSLPTTLSRLKDIAVFQNSL